MGKVILPASISSGGIHTKQLSSVQVEGGGNADSSTPIMFTLSYAQMIFHLVKLLILGIRLLDSMEWSLLRSFIFTNAHVVARLTGREGM